MQAQSQATPKKKTLTNATTISTPKKKFVTAIDNATESHIVNEDITSLTRLAKEDQYVRLMAQLEAQIALCSTISAYYLKSGNKNLATTFLQYKKTFSADLTSLTSYQKHNKDIPPFHFRDVTYNVENAFFELSANDMEICIERAWNLGNKEVNGKDVEAYVNWNIGWPTEGSPGAGSGKGDTSVAKKSMDPEFNYKKIISIERTKPFQRFIERKKAIFEVFHYRGFFSFQKAVSLGKAQVKLDSLSSKAEIHEVLDLMDTNRRTTGGKLEIRLRLRTPILKADVIQKTEKWLIIDGFNLNNPIVNKLTVSTPVSEPSIEITPVKPISITSRSDPLGLPATSDHSTPVQPHTPTKSNTLSVQTPNTTSSIPTQVHSELPSQVSTPVSTPRPSVTISKDIQSLNDEANDLELAEEQLNDVDLIVSTGLLQEEIELVNSQISSLESQGKPIPDDLSDRKSELEIKMSFMEIQVQTGQLTIDKYLDQVRASIADFKKLALVFKKAGKVEEAKKALVRSKVMENEVKQIEETMAGGGMNGVDESSNEVNEELELAEDQLNNVDSIVSTGLLQEEIELVNSQILTLESQGKPIPDDLSDRKSALEIKMSLMEIQVQTGQLTIDKYLDQVRDSIANFKRLALVFKKGGKIEEAKKALVKSKVMENEVKQMEIAMAGGEIDDA